MHPQSTKKDIYPTPTKDAPPTAASPKVSPHAAFEVSVLNEKAHQIISDRIPALKQASLILFLLAILTGIYSFVAYVQQRNGELPYGIIKSYFMGIGLATHLFIVGVAIAAIILIQSRNSRTIRHTLEVIGLFLATDIMVSLIHFNLIGVAFGVFVLWKLYELYQVI